jgi:hypothetical protein
MATSRPSASSQPAQTTPMPPRPSDSPRRYRPPRSLFPVVAGTRLRYPLNRVQHLRRCALLPDAELRHREKRLGGTGLLLLSVLRLETGRGRDPARLV